MRREDWAIIYVVAGVFAILLLCWFAADWTAWHP